MQAHSKDLGSTEQHKGETNKQTNENPQCAEAVGRSRLPSFPGVVLPEGLFRSALLSPPAVMSGKVGVEGSSL